MLGLHGDIVEVPNNAVVKENQNASLYCKSDKNYSIIWRYYSVNSTEREQISGVGVSVRNATKHAVQNTSGRYSLYVKTIQLSDAGTYVCFETYLENEAQAQIIVLGKYIFLVILLATTASLSCERVTASKENI